MDSDKNTLHISNLPTGFIVDVSAYLPKPSRAILAVAFTSSSLWQNNDVTHRLTPISTAIISALQWDTLDFEDIEKELANKLTDDDIYSILISINAHDVLKRLKLCGCTNIEGHGLNPLRESVVLELIDLSLAKRHETRKDVSESMICVEYIMPILDSIISSNGFSLRHVHFPKKWYTFERYNATEEVYPIMEFERRFNRQLEELGLDCAKCNMNMRRNDMSMRTCYECLCPICDECIFDERMARCDNCEKVYCIDCVPCSRCEICCNILCRGCQDMEVCDACGHPCCEDCLYVCNGCNRNLCSENCVEIYSCDSEGCPKSHCEDCYNGKEYSVTFCGECSMEYCLECKLDDVKANGVDSGCRACAADTIPTILEENKRQKEELATLRREVEEYEELTMVFVKSGELDKRRKEQDVLLEQLRKEKEEVTEELKQKEAEGQRRKEEFEKEMEDIEKEMEDILLKNSSTGT